MTQVLIFKSSKFGLTKREVQLIIAIRKLRFGKLEIDVRDGVIQDKVKQKEKITDLSKIALDNIL